MSQMAIEEAGPRLSELVKDARVGEEIVLTENDQPIARLMVMSKENKSRPRRGSRKNVTRRRRRGMDRSRTQAGSIQSDISGRGALNHG